MAATLQRALKRGALAAAALLLLYALLGWLAVPAAVRWALETVASRELGRAVSVREVRANPFTLRVTVAGLSVADAAGPPLAALETLTVNLSTTSLFHRAPVLDALAINGLALNVVRLAPQRFNFSDIVERLLAQPASGDEPARFSLNNIALANGRIDFDDRVLGRQHELTDIALGIPFLSNLPADVLIEVHPALSARINGTPLSLAAEALPFDPALDAAAHLKLDGLDLPTYVAFAPVQLPVEVASGKLDTDLRIAFRRAVPAQDGQPARAAALLVSGSAALRELDLRTPASAGAAPLLSWSSLTLHMAEFAPLERRLHLSELALAGAQANLVRHADGTLNWTRLVDAAPGTAVAAGPVAPGAALASIASTASAGSPGATPAATAPATDRPAAPSARSALATPSAPAAPATPAAPAAAGAAASAPASASASASAAAPATPWRVTLDRLVVTGGRLRFTDETAGRAVQQLDAIELQASALTTAAPTPASVKLAARLAPAAPLAVTGTLTLAPLAAELDLVADELPLRAAAPYLAQAIDGELAGTLALRGRLQFAAGSGDAAADLRLGGLALDAKALRLRGPADSGAALDIAQLSLAGGELDLRARALRVESLKLDAPRGTVERLADGTIGWQRLLRSSLPAPARGAAAAPEPPWLVRLQTLELARGQLQASDAAVQPPLRVTLDGMQLRASNLSADGGTRAALNLRTRVGRHGSLALDGGVHWDRLRGELKIDARNLDATVARPYFAPYLNAELASAEASAQGRVRFEQPAAADAPMNLRFDGGLRLANLHALDPSGNDLLRWQILDVEQLAVALGADPPAVQIGRVALADFFARVIISEQGRLNLADLVRRNTQGSTAAPAATAAGETAAAPTTATANVAPAAHGTAAARPRIRIDRIDVARGNVNFTDNFIRPNYTANLTAIGGSVTALASDAAEPATLALAGSVDGEAPVQISGRLNPLAPTLFIDIAGSTKGVDLPRFTPYAAKYAGYPIIKGKLSMDVSYRIDGGKLAANNRLFLDQLTFGDKVDSPEATQLPVLLAVALLKNGRGEIDISLPIAGSLDDPQFSLGRVVVQVIVNLLTKAVTAPFSLLAAAFGGGEELGFVEFGAGGAALEPAQDARLQRLAKALTDRPGLRLDIIGRAEPALDADGLRRAKLDALLRAARAQHRVRDGGAAADPAALPLSAEERQTLLAAVYAEASIPDKPRNALGIARKLPAADMEQRLLAQQAVGPAELRALANARASTVRDWLQTEGKVARERLFLVEPRLTAEGIADKGAPTRVDFALR